MPAGRRLFVLFFGVLASCATPPPSETVQLSRPSPIEMPLGGGWHKASEKRPIAVLLGRAETTRVIMPRKAVLRVSCDRSPSVRVAYDVGLKSGPIAVAYRFDAKTERKGVVPVRGSRHNALVIDNPPAVTAFDADLLTSSTLKVRATRPPFEMHDAYFSWDPADKALKDVLAACNTHASPAGRRQQPTSKQDGEYDDSEDDIKDVLPEQQP